jgi:lipopolysaccharide transport system permease protein
MNRSILISPNRGWLHLNLPEIWKYRELLFFLGWRDVKIRYKQTALGTSWAIIQPLMTTVVFSFFFGQLAQLPSDGIPYPVFSLAAVVPWTLFSACINRGSASIVSNSHLIKKIYFPRLCIPIAILIPALFDFLIAFLVLVIIMLWYGVVPPMAALITVPLLTLLLALFGLSISLWLGALNVYYRDVGHALPFLTQLWMFSSPIIFPFSLVPARYRDLVELNPLVGIIEGYRSALLQRPWLWRPLIISTTATFVLIISGLYLFRRLESDFADIA